MMIGSVAASVLFTILFAAAALCAALPPARSERGSGLTGTAFCIAMCTALIAMTWFIEPASVVWPQVVLFGGAALWLATTRPAGTRRHDALMAAAMTWMLASMPARGAMPGMPGATPSLVILTVSGLVAACCVAASIPWVTRADPGALSKAAMGVGMAAMLIAML